MTSTIALEGDGTATEYAGGYSDYLIQRGPREAPAPVAAAPRKEKAAAPARETKARLGYKRERALAELPKKIEALHAEMATLNRRSPTPTLYAATPDFQAKTNRLGAAQAELDAAETEWLELEMLREELGG